MIEFLWMMVIVFSCEKVGGEEYEMQQINLWERLLRIHLRLTGIVSFCLCSCRAAKPTQSRPRKRSPACQAWSRTTSIGTWKKAKRILELSGYRDFLLLSTDHRSFADFDHYYSGFFLDISKKTQARKAEAPKKLKPNFCQKLKVPEFFCDFSFKTQGTGVFWDFFQKK